MTKYPQSFHFISAPTARAKQACQDLINRYSQTERDQADAIIVLGGDGTMLHSLRDFMNSGKALYGMHCGSVGFLMNEFSLEDLPRRVSEAHRENLHPLRMQALTSDNQRIEALAVNEISLFRQSHQAAKIQICVDGKNRMEELICDGLMLATPVGSTAYNLSAQGPILPLIAPLLALTPVSPFRPRRWHGALLPNTAEVRFNMLESDKRPVNAAADAIEVKSVRTVTIAMAMDVTSAILFDFDHSWNERILSEQFRHG